MRAVGKKALEPRFGFRHCIGPRDAGDVETARMRVRDQRGFDLMRIAQKSRLA